MNIENIMIRRSVENTDMSGSIRLKDKIQVNPDEVVEVSLGYASSEVMKLIGQVTRATSSGSAKGFESEIEISALSLFKNFMKHRISTDWLEDMNGQQVLELLVGEFMSWNKYNFSACAGVTFARVRVEDMLLPEAVRGIAEACLTELYFDGDGTIIAVPFAEIGEPDHEYKPIDISRASCGNGLDIGTINTIKLFGRRFDPSKDDIALIPVGKEEFSWSKLGVKKVWREEGAYGEGYWTEWAIAVIPLDLAPVVKPRIIISGETIANTASYILRGHDDNAVWVGIERNPAHENEPPDIGYPDFDFTITVEGFLYQDRDFNRVHTNIENSVLLDKYNGIRMEKEHTNEFVQDKSALTEVGNYEIKKAYLESYSFQAEGIHNPDLQPNDKVKVAQVRGNELWVIDAIVRTIETTMDSSYALVDMMRGWYNKIRIYEIDPADWASIIEYDPSEYDDHPDLFDFKEEETAQKELPVYTLDDKEVHTLEDKPVYVKLL